MIANADQMEFYERKLKIKWYILNEIINCFNFIICFKWNVYSRKNVLKKMNYFLRKFFKNQFKKTFLKNKIRIWK
jgi:hypothetical protein